MQHRGPDDAGEWWSANGLVGFGHRRLAIVDLTPSGHQPMVSSSGELIITFNGEIYNFQALQSELQALGHVFVSSSDTEVILAAYRQWDLRCLDRLHGMFAIAIFDQRQQRLLLARDRAGEKPLFYYQDSGSIRFASELKGILADPLIPRRLDWESFDCYLADGFVPGGRSILRGFNKLPAAHALTYSVTTGKTAIWPFWKTADAPLRSDVTNQQLLHELEIVLASAVERQLVADVPVGVLLSGGIDSSLITAFAARSAASVRTFTVRFPGYGSYDETSHARLIASHFGTRHCEIDAAAADVSLLPRLARQFDEPIIDSSMVPTFLVSEVVQRHCKVVLGGDGGDELFGGYPHYDRMLRFAKVVRFAPVTLRAMLAMSGSAILPAGIRGRNWLLSLAVDWRREVPFVTQIFDAGIRRKLLGHNAHWRPVAEAIRASGVYPSSDLLQRATRQDFATYLADDLLVKVDRASMFNSLEVRAPMLDAAVLDFAFGRVPSRLKATTAERKILLKRLAAKLLPPSFDLKRKQGFSIPLADWLQRGSWRNFFLENLLESGAQWFDRRLVHRMLQNAGKSQTSSERLFGLLMFELWRREYRVEL